MLALVLARGGSKRLPGKNLKSLAGKPLIQHTLETAVKAQKIARVLFSTDSPKMRDLALSIDGVEAPFLRPDEFASDSAQAADVHFHTLDWLKEHEGQAPENICIMLPTSPLRLPEDIDNAIALFEETQADVVTSVVRTKPLAWHLNMNENSKHMTPLLDMNAQDAVRNHQEMPTPPVILNGSIYVIKVEPYRETRSYFGENTYGYEMPQSRSIDIDEPEDFLIAEALLKARA